VKTVIFPLENKKDFDELPENIRSGIEARFVNYFDEVLDIVY
jgi:ATP-dependent Lon protease